jgi:hypothetical protein
MSIVGVAGQVDVVGRRWEALFMLGPLVARPQLGYEEGRAAARHVRALVCARSWTALWWAGCAAVPRAAPTWRHPAWEPGASRAAGRLRGRWCHQCQ